MPGCTNELTNLAPTITSCPGSNELILFCNVSGVPGGYAFRPWHTVAGCLLSNLVFVPIQFEIGQIGSPMVAGDTELTVLQNGVVEDSVMFVLGSGILPRNDNTQISYSVDYSVPGRFTITLNQAVSNGQQYILTYAYSNLQ